MFKRTYLGIFQNPLIDEVYIASMLPFRISHHLLEGVEWQHICHLTKKRQKYNPLFGMIRYKDVPVIFLSIYELVREGIDVTKELTP